MNASGIDIQKLKSAASFLKNDTDSYRQSYPEFINYFAGIPTIERHNLIIASHFTYGWMPTILNLDLSNGDLVISLLNRARGPELLKVEDLQILKLCVNNSLVGTSKLLHFINPAVYPIWDSNIFRFYSGKKHTYGISSPQTYLSFLTDLHQISDNPEVTELYNLVMKVLGYSVTRIRALELIMFEAGRLSKLSNSVSA
jgi:hypothetical protein